MILASASFYSQWSALIPGVVLIIVAFDYATALELEGSHGARHLVLYLRDDQRHLGCVSRPHSCGATAFSAVLAREVIAAAPRLSPGAGR